MKVKSFNVEFLDDLLRSKKQQTSWLSGKQIYEVGEQIAIYNQMELAIYNNPVRRLTITGKRHYYEYLDKPQLPCLKDYFFANLLGIVTLTNVYEFQPSRCLFKTDHGADFLDIWAQQDGFKDFDDANEWFVKNVSVDWMDKIYDVLQWKTWDEVYFFAED